MKKLLTTLGLGIATIAFAMNVSVAPTYKLTSIENNELDSQTGVKFILEKNIKDNFGINIELTAVKGKTKDSLNEQLDTNFYQAGILPTYTFQLGKFKIIPKIGAEYTNMFTKFDDTYVKFYGLNFIGGLDIKYKKFILGLEYSKGKIKEESYGDKFDLSQTSFYVGYTF